MTRKFLMTVAIIAIALTPRLALVIPRPTALAEVLAGSTAADLADMVFMAGMAAAFTADTGVGALST